MIDSNKLQAPEGLKDVGYVASLVGKPVSSIYDLARRNLIPHIRVGKSVRFDAQKIRDWLEQGGSKVAQ